MYAVLLVAGLVTLPQPGPPRGHLILVGGGTTPPEITRKALELAHGRASRVLVIPQASDQPDRGDGPVQLWRDAGAAVVEVLDVNEPDKGVAAIRSADVLWLGGGDQNRLMRILEKTGLAAVIRERYRKGAVVGGTSAGASAAARRMPTGDADPAAVRTGATHTADGLNLLPGTIVDQHFSQRQRFNRLLSAVIDHPDLLGIGLDESTGIVVSGSRLEVFGKGSVVVIDARRARGERSEPGESAAATNLTLHVLKAGMNYRLQPDPPHHPPRRRLHVVRPG